MPKKYAVNPAAVRRAKELIRAHRYVVRSNWGARAKQQNAFLERHSWDDQALAAVWFYKLFRPINPVAAWALGVFGMINAMAILASSAAVATALKVAADTTLAPGDDAAATTQLLFRLSESFWGVGALFFGLWLIPMGWVAATSGRFPRALGWILVAGGLCYVVTHRCDGSAGIARVVLHRYRLRMDEADRDVLKFIGDEGKTAEQVADRFPAFDVDGLVRAELVRPRRTTQSRRAPAAPDPTFYVLTSRGAEAIGLDPYTLHSA